MQIRPLLSLFQLLIALFEVFGLFNCFRMTYFPVISTFSKVHRSCWGLIPSTFCIQLQVFAFLRSAGILTLVLTSIISVWYFQSIKTNIWFVCLCRSMFVAPELILILVQFRIFPSPQAACWPNSVGFLVFASGIAHHSRECFLSRKLFLQCPFSETQHG